MKNMQLSRSRVTKMDGETEIVWLTDATKNSLSEILADPNGVIEARTELEHRLITRHFRAVDVSDVEHIKYDYSRE